MALQYATGSAATVAALITAIRDFAVNQCSMIDLANSATNVTSLRGGNAGDDGDLYVHLDSNTANSLRAQPSTGFTNAVTFNNQPGSPSTTSNQWVEVNELNATMTYFLFGDSSSPRYVHCVIEVPAGVFHHFHFGTLAKFGAYTGGQYCQGHYWDTNFSNLDICWDPLPNGARRSWVRSGQESQIWERGGGFSCSPANQAGECFANSLFAPGYSPFNTRVPLAPNYVKTLLGGTTLSGVSDRIIVLGHTPGIRVATLEGVAPKTIITLGSDNWMFFPVRNLNINATSFSWGAASPTSNLTTNHTSLCGLAFKKA